MNPDTIAAIATPSGTGGVAIIRIAGANARAIAERITNRKNFQSNLLKPCAIFSADGAQKLDDGMVVFFQAPHSYTGEDIVELHCHGSYFLAQKILEEILKTGARLAAPGEFTKRAFLSGKIDLTQAESVAEMLAAGSELQLKLALKHLDGDVSQEIKNLRRDFLLLLAELEAALDYPEEIADPPKAKIQSALSAAQAKISKLLSDSGKGLLISSGARLVLAGRPNAGKSSLFNALLKHDRAIVTEIPGTTRDTLEAEISIRGVKAVLFDTAGLRDTEDKIEKLGVARSQEILAGADLVLYLIDSAAGMTDADKKTLSALQDKKHLVIISKADLPHDLSIDGALKISAPRGLGLDLLEEKILEILDLQNLDLNQNVYISSLRQKEKLFAAAQALNKALTALPSADYLDVLAVYLKTIAVALGEITGEETSGEIIDTIFANFCVGK